MENEYGINDNISMNANAEPHTLQSKKERYEMIFDLIYDCCYQENNYQKALKETGVRIDNYACFNTWENIDNDSNLYHYIGSCEWLRARSYYWLAMLLVRD